MIFKYKGSRIFYRYIDRKTDVVDVFLHGWGSNYNSLFFCHDYSGFSRLKVLLWKGSRRQAERGLHAGGRKNIDQIEARAPGSLSAGRFGTEVKMKDYAEYIAEQAQKLLAIDSPSGYTKNAAQYLCGVYRKLGYEPQLTVKGGVLVKLCEGTGAVPEAEGTGYGDPSRGPILLMAHTDTLGAMVSGITPEGRLKLTPLGGLNPNNTEAENCRFTQPFSTIPRKRMPLTEGLENGSFP